MKRLAVIASLLAALVSPSLALAGGSLVGKYSVKIATPSALKGTWVLSFAKNRTYTIAESGTIVVHGHYVSLGSEVTLSQEKGPRACSQFGDYTWKRTATTLKLTKVSDPCAGRLLVLGHPLKVVG